MSTYSPEPYTRDPAETVQCPQCQCFNSPDAKYCDQCGYEMMGSPDVQMERRSAELVNPSVDGLNVTGYAAVFDSPWSQALIDANGYQEVISRGAFRKVLSSTRNVPLLWRHNTDEILASTRSGTLKLKEDGRGLAVNATLPDSPRGHDVAALVANGTVAGMSFGFTSTRSDSMIDRNTKPPTRNLRSMQSLLDVSLTWDPAYDTTSAELRAEQFAAVRFEDLVSGEEPQTDQIATDHRMTSAAIAARLRAIEINELLLGGNNQCGEMKSQS